MKKKVTRGKKQTNKHAKAPRVDLRPFLPGGSVERDYRRLQTLSRERRDVQTDQWFFEKRPVPSIVPARVVKAVISATRDRTEFKLDRQRAEIADKASHLREIERHFKILRHGRPSGPSLEGNRQDFVAKVTSAIRHLETDGIRVTCEKVAETLGRDERTFRRHREKFGFSSWRKLRDDARADLISSRRPF